MGSRRCRVRFRLNVHPQGCGLPAAGRVDGLGASVREFPAMRLEFGGLCGGILLGNRGRRECPMSSAVLDKERPITLSEKSAGLLSGYRSATGCWRCPILRKKQIPFASSVPGRRRGPNGNFMKKARSSRSGELRREYKRSDFRGLCTRQVCGALCRRLEHRPAGSGDRGRFSDERRRK